MYRRAEFFKIEHPLSIQKIAEKLGAVTDRKRQVPDKNALTKKIVLSCSFSNQKMHDDYYVSGMELQYQITARKGVPYQKTWDFFAFLFFVKKNVLVVLGRDTAITDAIKEVSKVLYGDTQDIRPFSSVRFEKDSLVRIITKLKKNDSDSWCDEHNALHGAMRYQGRKTKTNFSLGDGNCVLDDNEAKQEIANATTINPKYRFYRCPKLNGVAYDQPQTLRFNGEKGTIGIGRNLDFEHWEKFIAKFLLQHLEWS